MPTRKLISIVIPVYNEEGNVKRAYEAVKQVFATQLRNYDFEIVFTDNKSEDNTMGELRKMAAKDKRIRVASFVRNFGFNKSILTGYRLTRGDAAIQMDCDLQDPPTVFPGFVKKWEKGHDVVVGLRQKRDSEAKWIIALNKLFHKMLAKMSDDSVIVSGGDFRLVDKSVVDQLRRINDANPHVRILISSLAANQTVHAYDRQQREFGTSKFPFLGLVKFALGAMFTHSTAPLRLASLCGFVLAGLAVLVAAGYVAGSFVFGMNWPAGFATTTVLQLFGIGLNAIFLGIIGEYMGRIYTQLRDRPLTIIQETLNFDGQK